jgi:hypothetical protein
MKRRQFITLIGGAAAWPLAARALQSPNRIPVVGVLWHAGSAEEEEVYLSVLVKAFDDLGYAEGRNIHLDVEPQQVVLGKTEAADRCFGLQTSMRAMPIVTMQPVE